MNSNLVMSAVLSLCTVVSANESAPVSEAQTSNDTRPGVTAAKANRMRRKLCARLFEGKLDRARELTAAGADVNGYVERDDDRMLLHMAVERANLPVMELLLEAGANVNALTRSGWTSLHLAMANPKREVVKLLLEHRASLEPTDAFGATAIHYAAQFGEPRILALLLGNCSHELVAREDLRGWNALDCAVVFDREECARMLRKHLHKTLPLIAPVSTSKPGLLLAYLTGEVATRKKPETLEPLLNKGKPAARTRPVFWATNSPHNGPPSARNTVHLAFAVWPDGWYLVRPGYSQSEDPRDLPPLAAGLLTEQELAAFLAMVEETQYFNPSMPRPFSGPCMGRFDINVRGADRRKSDSASPSWNSSRASSGELSERVHQGAAQLLTRLWSGVLDVQTLPIDDQMTGRSIRGYNPESPEKTRWW